LKDQYQVKTLAGETLLELDDHWYELQEYIGGEPYDHDRPTHLEEAALTLGTYHSCGRDFAPAALCSLGELYTPRTVHEMLGRLAELYRACQAARAMLTGGGPHGVSRVIARPFVGTPGAFHRTANRRDFSLDPVGPTLLDVLADRGIPRLGIGKVDDLFNGRNITSTHTPTNADAYRLLRDALRRVDSGLVFANVIEFDQSWGHRNDVLGFQAGLRELDRELGSLLTLLREDDLFVLTADHGNDPTTPSTDHARENVPLLVCGPRVRSSALGERETFADLGQSAAEYFGVGPLAAGTSFLREIAW